MPDIESLRSEVHDLGKQVAGMQPMVSEVHSQMPRIAKALEDLARISEKQENNVEDHRRIHFRVTEIDEKIKTLKDEHDELKQQYETTRQECLVCTTTKKVEARVEQTSIVTKVKNKAVEKTVEIVTLAIITFMAWMVVSHLKEYQDTANVIDIPQQTKGAIK